MSAPEENKVLDPALDWITGESPAARRAPDWSRLEAELYQAEAEAAAYAAASTPLLKMPAELELKLRLAAHEQFNAPVSQPWYRSIRLAWAVAAFASVMATVLAVQPRPVAVAPAPQVAQAPQDSADKGFKLTPASEVLSFQPGPDAAGSQVTGRLVWDPKTQRGYLELTGLPVNDPKLEQYQLWIFDAERDQRYPVDGGVFDASKPGLLRIAIDARIPVQKPALFAVTLEKAGGVVVSDRGRIVALAKPESKPL